MTDIENKLRYEGKIIVLPCDPKDMTIKEAIKQLTLIEEEQETEMSIAETVEAFPLEGAYAMIKAMQRLYGWARPLPADFFNAPPKTMTLEIGFKEYAQVIWGRFSVPAVKDGVFQTGVTRNPITGALEFCINGKFRRKYLPEVKALADMTRKIVVEESIYRHQAINLNTDESGSINWNSPPTFIDLRKVRPEELIYNRDTMIQVATNLFAPIMYTEETRRMGVPLKRGVLLEGPWGTGKTLLAFATAFHCVRNSWTFIMVDRVSGLREALQFAQRYQPAVVFAEDIDRAVSGEERTQDIDDVLNTVDGIQAKGTEIFVVLTSNHVDRINGAMLRPGRLDAVISIDLPDADTVTRLIRLFGRDLVHKTESVAAAAEELAGQVPATVREVVERSKLYALFGTGGNPVVQISGIDLLNAAKQMKKHLALLNSKGRKEPSAAEKFYESFGVMLSGSVGTTISGLQETASDLDDTVGNFVGRLDSVHGDLLQHKEVDNKTGDALIKGVRNALKHMGATIPKELQG